MKFSNLRIGARLALGFLTVCVFLAAVAAVGIYSVQRTGHDVETIVSDRWPKTVLANDAIDIVNANGLHTFYVIMLEGQPGTEAEVKERTEAMAQNSRRLTEIYEKLGKLLHSEEGKALFQDRKSVV